MPGLWLRAASISRCRFPGEEGERVVELKLVQGAEGGNKSCVVGGVGRIRRLGPAVVGSIPVQAHAVDKETVHIEIA